MACPATRAEHERREDHRHQSCRAPSRARRRGALLGSHETMLHVRSLAIQGGPIGSGAVKDGEVSPITSSVTARVLTTLLLASVAVGSCSSTGAESPHASP